jgi:transposase-like protein
MTEKHMKEGLSYYEYQKRLKAIRTPEEAAEFAQELLAPMLAGMAKKSRVIEAEEEVQEDPVPAPLTRATRKQHIPKDERTVSASSPWADVTADETENAVISLYAKGLSTRDIVSHLKRSRGVEMSQSSVSAITDKVYPLVKEWQSRPLASCYPILYLDGLHFKVREAGKIVPKVAYVALGVSQYGEKDVLGIWTSDSEGSKFWMGVLTDLKNRGVDDVFIACVDGLKGFPEAIKAVFPHADVQVCIAHQVRHTMKFVPFRDRKAFCDDLKAIYTAPTEEAGADALREVTDRWPQYRPYLKSWENRWGDLAPFFGYPEPIRKMIYTTNAIENLNRQFRKVTKTTTVFPHNDALLKLLWLAQADITQSWTLPVRQWNEAMAQMSILFPDRVQF